MANLRREARDRPCQIRGPSCNGDPATTVLAHLNGGGMGRKHEDLFGAWACDRCHSLVDGRDDSVVSFMTRKLWHLEGMMRTQQILLSEGKIKI
jgi:hypothetical protein